MTTKEFKHLLRDAGHEMLTPGQTKVLLAIMAASQYVGACTISQINKLCGFSSTNATIESLNCLEKLGYIRRLRKKGRTIRPLYQLKGN